MKLIGATLCLAMVGAVGLRAQTETTKVTTENGNSKTTVQKKVEVKDGQNIKTIGCVDTNPAGDYVLENVSTGAMRYTLVSADDLSAYVGHRVSVSGKATDLGRKAKVKIESTTTSENESVGTTGQTEVTTASEGTLRLPYLGVKSVKIVPGACH
jgi:hypothetical protein